MVGTCCSLENYRQREAERDLERRDAYHDKLMRYRYDVMPAPPKGEKLIITFDGKCDLLARYARKAAPDSDHPEQEWVYIIDLSTLPERVWEALWMGRWPIEPTSLRTLDLEGWDVDWDPAKVEREFAERTQP